MNVEINQFNPGCEISLCPDRDNFPQTIAGKVALATDHIRQATENFIGPVICTSAKVQCEGALDVPVVANGTETTIRLCGAKVTEISLNIELK